MKFLGVLIPLVVNLTVFADSTDPPDIHSQTLYDYVYGVEVRLPISNARFDSAFMWILLMSR